MAVITQAYDVDLKATGWYPVVEMSQYDTGSRTIVLTVYDGHELVPLDGCVARIDGRRSDGVEFSASCSVGTGSRVSFTITQEMTRAAGKHVAELVIIDSAGDTVGTQNFILAVEPASMLRDAAASADDRTLYDQYTSSIESKFNSLSKDVNRTVEDISQAIGATSKPKVIVNQSVAPNGYNFDVRMVYDPVTALVTLRVATNGVSGISTTNTYSSTLLQIPADYLPDASLIDPTNGYTLSSDMMQPEGTGHSDTSTKYVLDSSGNLIFKVWLPSGNSQWRYGGDCNASWYARGGKYMGVETIGTGGNTIKVGTVTTGEPGTQATVTNSGTIKDVVLDFTIPKGDKGDTGGTIPVASATTLGGIKVGSNLSITDDGTLSATGGTSGGFDSTADPIVIGSGADGVSAQGNIIIGKSALAYKGYTDNIAIGTSAEASGKGGSVAIGNEAKSMGSSSASVAIGASATVGYAAGVAIGDGANAYRNATAVGYRANGDVYGTAIGVGATAKGNNNTGYAAVAIGDNATANAGSGPTVAIGQHASAPNSYSVAIGAYASAPNSYSVAIGAYSTTTAASVVSVGDGSTNAYYGTRRIVNVGEPTADNDAATKAYVDRVCASLASLISDLRARVAALENK